MCVKFKTNWSLGQSVWPKNTLGGDIEPSLYTQMRDPKYIKFLTSPDMHVKFLGYDKAPQKAIQLAE